MAVLISRWDLLTPAALYTGNVSPDREGGDGIGEETTPNDPIIQLRARHEEWWRRLLAAHRPCFSLVLGVPYFIGPLITDYHCL